MQTEQFEIVVILEGIVETTGEWPQTYFGGLQNERLEAALLRAVAAS